MIEFQKNMNPTVADEMADFIDVLLQFIHEYECDVNKRDPETGKTADVDTQTPGKSSLTLGSLIGEYVIVRSYDSGVHAGYMKEYDPQTRHIHLTQSRRLWKWMGFTLSEVANNGVGDNNGAKITEELNEIFIANVIEIIPCSPKAKKNIKEHLAHIPTK